MTQEEKQQRWRSDYASRRDAINARRRERRLEARKKRLAGKHCLNCDILLSVRLVDTKRSFVYCRKCLDEHPVEVRRDKWRRYYRRKRGKEQRRRKQREDAKHRKPTSLLR